MTRLSGRELERARAEVTAAIDVARMWNLPPYVYGDATARRMGCEPVGLPDAAGYAAGLRRRLALSRSPGWSVGGRVRFVRLRCTARRGRVESDRQ